MMTLSSISVGAAAPYASSTTPYPSSVTPTEALYVVSSDTRTPAELLCLDTLAGNLARLTPRLYRVSDALWEHSTSDSYAAWLREMRANGVRVDTSLVNESILSIITHFTREVKGFILANGSTTCVNSLQHEDPQHVAPERRCNGVNSVGTWSWARPASISAAMTLAAAGDGLIVAADLGLASRLKSLGVPLAFDARNAIVNAVLQRPGVLDALSREIFVFQDPSKSQFLGDYSVFARAASLAFGSDPVAQKALLGSRGGSSRLGAAFGWGPENAYVSTCNEQAVYVHASDYCMNLAALSNARVATARVANGGARAATHDAADRSSSGTPRHRRETRRHTVAFVMSDGDNLQWVLGPFSTDIRWWQSPQRGRQPVGWTLSPALAYVAPAALSTIQASRTEADELVAGPSGVGYMYPKAWPHQESAQSAFAERTSDAMQRSGMQLVNVLAQNDDPPGRAYLAPLLNETAISGAIYYPWGGGYSALAGRMWRLGDKLLVSGRVSLWGNGTSGTMLGVQPLIDHLLAMPRIPESADGYSLIPVHVWSHSLDDVAHVVRALRDSGAVDVVLPSELFRRINERVWTVSCTCDSPGAGTAGHNHFSCSDGTGSFCASNEECYTDLSFVKGDSQSGCQVP